MSKARPKILVVDDVEVNGIILQEILSDTYDVQYAPGGMEAVSVLLNTAEKPDLVLLDIMMPDMDGFQVMTFMKSDITLYKIPVIFITATDEEQRGLEVGAVDFITKPFDPNIIKLRVANHIELSLYRENLEELLEKKTQEILVQKEIFMEAMANLIEYRSLESGQHVKRTKELAHSLALQLLKNADYAEELLRMDYRQMVRAVPLHDIGKIAVPDYILLKPGKLTDKEFEIIKSHTTVGGSIIESLMKQDNQDEYLNICYQICRYHHERWNGTGYPDGIKGEDIPLAARIVAIVDVYDALTNKRCYKEAFSHEKALEIIKEESGKHFDPAVAEAFIKTFEQ